jgi:Domain of unknown function (DUF4407)
MAMTIGTNGNVVDKKVQMDAGVGNDCLDLPPGSRSKECPSRPHWDPGKPGFLSRCFMKIADVDMHLAGEMPADEQQQMKRVGISLAFGAMFRGIAFSTALSIGFDFDWWWTVPVTLILSGIMWSLDTKFVGMHWMAQGLAFCRSRGLIQTVGWQDEMRRIAAIAVRWTFSVLIAYVLTEFVALQFFDAEIESYFAELARSQNRVSIESASQQYEALISRSIEQIRLSDQKIDTLGRDRMLQVQTGVARVVDIDRQIEQHLYRIKKLQVDRNTALQSMNDFRQDVAAETRGVQLHEGFHVKFYSAMAALHEAIAKTKMVDIDEENRAIASLQQQRTIVVDTFTSSNNPLLASMENNLRQEIERRTSLLVNLRASQEWRADSIAKRIRTMSNYAPWPEGVLAKLKALSVIAARDTFVASLIFSAKILIMLLESAGPLTKVVFTTPGLYQLSIALRLHDYADLELDRLLSSDYRRLTKWERRDEALENILAKKERWAIEAKARAAFHKVIELMR